MKFNQLLILFIISLSVLIACNNKSSSKTEEPASTADTNTAAKPLVFDQLTGTWKSEDGQNFERWIKNEDGTYKTDVYSLKGTDTTWKESGRVYPENSNWVYENKVTNQNDGKVIKFTSTKMSDNSVQF
ncbi:MAG TPA: hypothetical protein VF476_11250, partial [Chitinophagaceae bacterium]